MGMKIGFYAQGVGEHLEIAKHLIASAKRVMPDVPVFQLTDMDTPALCPAIRLPENIPMGVRRLQHYATLRGDWCFVDSDVIFQRDVRSVFDDGFDVAVVSRIGTYMENSVYTKTFPYNFGVVFSRCQEFWASCLPILQKMTPALQEWEGEQRAMCEIAASGPFKIEVLPSEYNFTPKTREEDFSDKAIIHYKGMRKAWITTQP